MARYANETSVTVEKSISDLRTVIRRYGAAEMGVFEGNSAAGLMFTLKGRRIKMTVPIPTLEEIRVNAAGARMADRQAKQALEKATRQRWRALVLCVTAKLEAVESGIETLEQAFMAHLLLADGKTMSEVVLPQIESGAMKLLGGGS